MDDFDTEAFAKAFAAGLAKAMGGAEGPAAPSPADLAKAVRDNPDLDVDKIVERWQGLQSKGDEKLSDGGDAKSKDDGKAKGKVTTIDDLFAAASEASSGASTTKGSGSDKVDLMSDRGERLQALQSLFS